MLIFEFQATSPEDNSMFVTIVLVTLMCVSFTLASEYETFEQKRYDSSRDNYYDSQSPFDEAAIVWFENQYIWLVDTFWNQTLLILGGASFLLFLVIVYDRRKKRAHEEYWRKRRPVSIGVKNS